MIPHGESVSLTAPAAFRFTFPADPERHLRAASLLDPSGASTRSDFDAGAGSRAGSGPGANDDRERLPRAIVALMRDIGTPSGIGAVGYTESDIPELVEGTLKQQRLLSMAPRDVSGENLTAVFRGSIANW
jgi:alcohol dehydrogenase class IV